MSGNQPTLIRLIPLLFVFLWSTGFLGAKYTMPFIEPFYLLFLRFSITVGIFLLLCIAFKASWPSPKMTAHQMVSGLLIHGAYLGGVFAAIKWGMPAGIAAIIVGLQPVLTALLSWQLMNEQLRPLQWLGLGLGLIGIIVVILTTRGAGQVELSTPALITTVLSLIGISVGTLYQKRFGAGVDLLAGSLWQYASAAVAMGILAWTLESREVVWDIQLVLGLTWLIFGLSITAVLLLMYMIREGESAKVASYFYLVPVVVSIEAWFLFDESLPPLAIAAIVLTVLGVYLVVKKRT